MARREAAAHYADAYRRYCWPVHSLDDLKLAPFHLLATEGKTYFDRDHAWHMETLRTLALADPAEVEAVIQWWTELTAAGGEGMVVKPYDFVSSTRKGLLRPALKCRGREYLRIIYGPDYLLPGNLERLKQRNVKTKRNLALREFALGVGRTGAIRSWPAAAKGAPVRVWDAGAGKRSGRPKVVVSAAVFRAVFKLLCGRWRG